VAADPDDRRAGAAGGALNGALEILDETHLLVAPCAVD
jgi:hypothetical protein